MDTRTQNQRRYAYILSIVSFAWWKTRTLGPRM